MQEHSSDVIQKKAACLARTRAALNDVDRERLIDGKLVLAWVSSWGTENEKSLPIDANEMAVKPVRIDRSF